MECQQLDFLVRLAALGASGVCIFAIFWIGMLIRKASADPEHHKTLRHFMGIAVIITIVSAGSGIANAMIKQKQIDELERTTQALSSQNSELTMKVQEAQMAARAIRKVLSAKESTELRHPSPELRPQIELLRAFVDESLPSEQ